ncbi:MAG: acyl--CoA ligase [Candidatus Thiodiazotropha weberae]|nr:acyl--CoA ligase [Candidatus Thiodiazotropha weberae]
MTTAALPLIDRFKTIAESYPEKLAIADASGQYSYRQLLERISQVAGYLAESGLNKGDRVAMVVTNSANYAAIFYGIWAAGGVTVALNTQAKARDILNWTGHSNAKWLFIDQGHGELSEIINKLDQGVELVGVGASKPAQSTQSHTPWTTITQTRRAMPEMALSPSDLASIIYTSGTTGSPKGVTLSHANLSANIESIQKYLQLSSEDSILNVLPFYYSYGNSVLHTHLAVGGSLILENNLVYPHRVVERIANEAVSGFSGVPSTFALLLGRVNLSDYDLSNLRYLTQAGGAMAPALTDKLLAALPKTEIFIMYGQTEASARLTYLPPAQICEKRGSIGIAIPDTRIEVRDKQGKVNPPGVTGEICASGENIMQGYWRDTEKSAQVLKDGWLYTGDLAHIDEDGYLYIDGRSSDMIKSGANRISPKEIEEVIQELDCVMEVAVVGVPDEMLGEIIKAFIVPKGDQQTDKKAIQRHCKQNLAIYKIPKSIEFISELPKTASGKIQKFQLQPEEKS